MAEPHQPHKAVICPILIGRQIEASMLRMLIERAKSAQGQLILISGEAGIGKSRLLVEAIVSAKERDVLVFQGNCFPPDRSSPYGPFLDLLRSSQAKDLLASYGDSLESPLADLVRLHAALIPLSTGVTLPSLEPWQEKRRIFYALTYFLTELAAKQPILLIIEDIHWSDETSLEFLHYLARHCVAQPISIVATYRSDETPTNLRHWLAQLDRERLGQEITLQRLTQSQIEVMLQAIFERYETEHGTVRFAFGELLNTMVALTEGNPFFVEEILTSLMASGDIVYNQGAWELKSSYDLHIPRSIQDVVQSRTTHLSVSAQKLLMFAAVAGGRFNFSLLQQVMQCDEQHLVALLKELIAAQLVIEESEERFAFRHALMRQAIYTELLTRERKALHRIVAETMEQLYLNDSETHIADFAYHFYEAGIWRRASEYAQRAGEKAMEFHAPRAALDLLTHALSANSHLAIMPSARLYDLRGQAYELLGEFERARIDYEAALQLARSPGEGRAEWESLLHLGMLWSGRDYERSGEYYQHAFELASTIGEPLMIARSLNRMGNWHLNVERPLEAMTYHQEALEIFQRLQDKSGIAETLDLLGMTSYLSGDLKRGTAYYEQAVALFRELDNREGLTSSLATLSMRSITYQTDTMIPAITDASESIADGEIALKIARETGHRAAEAYALIFLANCLGPQGSYTRAFECAEQGLRIAQEIDHRQWITAAHCVLGALYRDLLAIPQAHQHFDQSLLGANEIWSPHWIHSVTGHLASTHVLAREWPRAENLLQANLTSTTPTQTLGQRLMWSARAELSLATNDPTQTLQILDQLMPRTATHGAIIRLMKLRGDALTALDQVSEAEIVLQHAREMAQHQEALPLLWRIHLALGKCYLAQRRYDAAEKSGLVARELIEQLALIVPGDSLRSVFLQNAHGLLSSLIPTSPRRAAKRTYDGLTERERQIAISVARGQSSREIASALIISERTVETHVGNILSKLGFRARTQIAAWATEKGLLKQDS